MAPVDRAKEAVRTGTQTAVTIPLADRRAICTVEMNIFARTEQDIRASVVRPDRRQG